MTHALHRATIDQLDAVTWHDIARLRQEVFIIEQDCPYPDLDARDLEPGAEHVWLTDLAASPGRQVLSYIRVLDEPDGARRIGRVVTRADARGAGLAKVLITDAIERHGRADLVLDAQTQLEKYYAAFGFEVAGPQFAEDGIPHLPMRRAGR